MMKAMTKGKHMMKHILLSYESRRNWLRIRQTMDGFGTSLISNEWDQKLY